MPRVMWTEEEWQLALKMRRGGSSYAEIGVVINRSDELVRMKFKRERAKEYWVLGAKPIRGNNVHETDRVVPDEMALAERDYRLSLSPRDLTAAYFNDPLPGYSALDRR